MRGSRVDGKDDLYLVLPQTQFLTKKMINLDCKLTMSDICDKLSTVI